LRPSPFADILRRAGAQVASGSWSGAAGRGLANFIDTRDVADVARVALLDDANVNSQRAYHLTGPRPWSMQEIAHELSMLLDRPVVYGERSPAQHRAALLAAGVDHFVVDLLLGLDEMFRESALAETTATVEQLTGRAPRSLPQWLTENIAVFRR
jgi:NAD(P)H dehydrogenase (quinone)